MKKRMPYFIKTVYNEKRLHSVLAYCLPDEYEKPLLTLEVLCV